MLRELTQEEFLEELADVVRERRERELDFVAVIFGAEGSGKSMASLIIANYLENNKLGEFDVIENVVYHAPEFLRVFNKGNQNIIVDEALNLMYSKEHMGNSYLAKAFFRGRYLLNNVFIVAQNLRWLDPVIREHRARLFILTLYEHGEYKWLIIPHTKARELHFVQKEYGYSNIKKYYGLATDVVRDVSIESIKDLIEQYKKLKHAENVLGALIDLAGIREQVFAKICSGIYIPKYSMFLELVSRFINKDKQVLEVLNFRGDISEVVEIWKKKIPGMFVAIETLLQENEKNQKREEPKSKRKKYKIVAETKIV